MNSYEKYMTDKQIADVKLQMQESLKSLRKQLEEAKSQLNKHWRSSRNFFRHRDSGNSMF